MSIAVDTQHRELAEAARWFSDTEGLLAAARERLTSTTAELPKAWGQMSELGWLGVHVPEELGGSGFGLVELAVLVAELAASAAPGPFIPTTAASAVIAALGSNKLREEALEGLLNGSAPAAIADSEAIVIEGNFARGRATLLGAGTATTLMIALADDVLVIPADRVSVVIEEKAGTDPTRDMGVVDLNDVEFDDHELIPGAGGYARAVFRTLLAADAAGVARGALDQTLEYVKIREQFGRIIGSFQAVKHHCADMLVNAESAEAAAWGAARAADGPRDVFELVAAAAAVVAGESSFANAELDIQLHGGIGFTWEHDAHLYFRRAIANRALLRLDDSALLVLRSTLQGARLSLAIDLPDDVESRREEVRAKAELYASLDEGQRRQRMRADGYLVPNWPAPWGVSASPALQMLIDGEFAQARVTRPSIGYAAFLVLTIVNHGTPEQIERWIPPVLEGRETWCQLFSEPGAGSDAAGIRTRGRKVEGGWIVSGQKVWSSGAHESRWGLATVRTDPDATKHGGITMLVVDMAADGVEIRPLRQITGEAHFNEVFLNDVFVPEADVIGEPGQGWPLARQTLGNERIVLGDGAGHGPDLETTLELFRTCAPGSIAVENRLGSHIARELALRLMNFRRALQTIGGGDAAALGAVTKLVGSHHGQNAANLNVQLVGQLATIADEDGGQAVTDLLSSRRFTIAGGTSEITRNQIAERLLGLPRELQGNTSRKGEQ